MGALGQTWNELLTKGSIEPKYLTWEHFKHLSPEAIKINLFNKMVSELKEPLPEGVFKVCGVHGNLTIEDAKVMPHRNDVRGNKRYSLRCNKCLMAYRRVYEIKNEGRRRKKVDDS